MRRLIVIIFLVLLASVLYAKWTVVSGPTLGSATVHNDSITYSHADTNDITELALDSFEIQYTNSMDTSNLAMIRILIIPEFKVDFLVVYDGGRVMPADEAVSTAIYEHFNLSMYYHSNKGVALVLQFEQQLDVFDCEGYISVYDHVANVIATDIPIIFLDQGDRTYGVILWDCKNDNERYVGGGAYLAVANIHVESKRTDLFHDETIKVMVAVKQ